MSDLNYLVGERRADKWALAFIETAKNNEGMHLHLATMLGWFANAIESGYDAGVKDALSKQVKDINPY